MSKTYTDAEMTEHLWKEIKKGRFGMLGLVGDRDHYQPMTAFAAPETGDIYFFTSKQTDLAKAVHAGGEAMFIVQSKDQDLHACIGGTLQQAADPALIDRFWSDEVAAWFPQGRTDPNITLLHLDARDAQVWLSETGAVKYVLAIIKARASHTEPDIGEHRSLDLSGGTATPRP
jgi:general stress protein 26